MPRQTARSNAFKESRPLKKTGLRDSDGEAAPSALNQRLGGEKPARPVSSPARSRAVAAQHRDQSRQPPSCDDKDEERPRPGPQYPGRNPFGIDIDPINTIMHPHAPAFAAYVSPCTYGELSLDASAQREFTAADQQQRAAHPCTGRPSVAHPNDASELTLPVNTLDVPEWFAGPWAAQAARRAGLAFPLSTKRLPCLHLALRAERNLMEYLVYRHIRQVKHRVREHSGGSRQCPDWDARPVVSLRDRRPCGTSHNWCTGGSSCRCGGDIDVALLVHASYYYTMVDIVRMALATSTKTVLSIRHCFEQLDARHVVTDPSTVPIHEAHYTVDNGRVSFVSASHVGRFGAKMLVRYEHPVASEQFLRDQVVRCDGIDYNVNTGLLYEGDFMVTLVHRVAPVSSATPDLRVLVNAEAADSKEEADRPNPSPSPPSVSPGAASPLVCAADANGRGAPVDEKVVEASAAPTAPSMLTTSATHSVSPTVVNQVAPATYRTPLGIIPQKEVRFETRQHPSIKRGLPFKIMHGALETYSSSFAKANLAPEDLASMRLNYVANLRQCNASAEEHDDAQYAMDYLSLQLCERAHDSAVLRPIILESVGDVQHVAAGGWFSSWQLVVGVMALSFTVSLCLYVLMHYHRPVDWVALRIDALRALEPQLVAWETMLRDYTGFDAILPKSMGSAMDWVMWWFARLPHDTQWSLLCPQTQWLPSWRDTLGLCEADLVGIYQLFLSHALLCVVYVLSSLMSGRVAMFGPVYVAATYSAVFKYGKTNPLAHTAFALLYGLCMRPTFQLNPTYLWRLLLHAATMGLAFYVRRTPSFVPTPQLTWRWVVGLTGVFSVGLFLLLVLCVRRLRWRKPHWVACLLAGLLLASGPIVAEPVSEAIEGTPNVEHLGVQSTAKTTEMMSGASFRVKWIQPYVPKITNTLVGVQITHPPVVVAQSQENAILGLTNRALKKTLVADDDALDEFFDFVRTNRDFLLNGPPVVVEPLPYQEWNAKYPAPKRQRNDRARANLLDPLWDPRYITATKAFLKQEHLSGKVSDLGVETSIRPRVISAGADEYQVLCGPWISAFQLEMSRRWHEDFYLTLTCGMQGHDIGRWYAKHHHRSYCLEGDFSAYDAGQNARVRLFMTSEVNSWFGVPDRIKHYSTRKAVRKHGSFACGVSFTCPGTMASGDPETYLHNSLLNGFLQAYAYSKATGVMPSDYHNRTHFPFHSIVSGDDNLTFSDEPYDSSALIARLGMDNVTIVRPDPRDAEFCSGIFLPAIVDGHPSYVLGLKPGRVHERFPWSVNLRDAPLLMLRGKALGLERVARPNPLIYPWISSIISQTSNVDASKLEEKWSATHSDADLREDHFRVRSFLHHRYGLTAADVDDFANWLAALPLTGRVTHPLVSVIRARDI